MSERVPENFIPWEQIEPLVREGMTGEDLRVAVLTALRLSPDRYNLLAVKRTSGGVPILDVLRGGVEIVSDSQAAEHLASGDARDCTDAVIA